MPPSRHSSTSSRSSGSRRHSSSSSGMSSSVSTVLVVIAIIIIFIIVLLPNAKKSDSDDTNHASLWTIYLLYDSDNTYRESNDNREYDKKLVWDDDYQSYYDSSTDCYLYYNEDVSPHVWQYWYEGISSDYGDYGWMEYRSGRWHIERSYDNWTTLPPRYDTHRLWHIS